jgi:hypothetical protein
VRVGRLARGVHSRQSLSFTAGSEGRKEGERAGACLTAGVLEFNKHLQLRRAWLETQVAALRVGSAGRRV